MAVTSIGTVVVDASVNEVHSLPATVTEHPVEQGADVTDHVRLQPLSLTIQGLITNNPIGKPNSQADGIDFEQKTFEWEAAPLLTAGVLGAIVGGVTDLLGLDQREAEARGFTQPFNRVGDVFQEFERLQREAEVITITTPLATYDNMVIENVDANMSAEAGGSLPFTLSARQVRIVSTQTVAAPPDPKDARGEGRTSGGKAPTKEDVTPSDGKKTSFLAAGIDAAFAGL